MNTHIFILLAIAIPGGTLALMTADLQLKWYHALSMSAGAAGLMALTYLLTTTLLAA